METKRAEDSFLKNKYELDLERTSMNMKLLRVGCGMKASELAEEFEVTKGMISKLENAQTVPTLSTVKKYCEKFGLTFEQLLVFKGDVKAEKSQNLMSDYLKSKGVEVK